MSQHTKRDRLAAHPRLRLRSRIAPTTILAILILGVSWFAPVACAEDEQKSLNLDEIKKLFIGSFGDKPGAAALRSRLIRRLERNRSVEIVANVDEADAVLTGTGEIWVTGYYSTNPKPSPWNRQAYLDGYLTVELRSRNGELLWSYRAKPGKWRWNGITQGLAHQVAKKLFEVLKPVGGPQP